MSKAYVELHDTKLQRRISYKFEENSRVNVDKMLREYTTDILGKNPAVLTVGEKFCFAVEKDSGGNIVIYQGDLKKFQDLGLNGLEKMSLSEEQVGLLKKL